MFLLFFLFFSLIIVLFSFICCWVYQSTVAASRVTRCGRSRVTDTQPTSKVQLYFWPNPCWIHDVQ
jgi:hypothetical protein